MAEINRVEEPELEQVSPEELERQRREQEWLSAASPEISLELITGDEYNRKLRLFAVACCRELNIRPDYSVETFKNAVDISERFAEGLVTDEELEFIGSFVPPYLGNHITPEPWNNSALEAAGNASSYSGIILASENPEVSASSGSDSNILFHKKFSEKRNEQANLLRDIIRNPFAKEPVHFEERWRTSDVIGVARAIYEDKKFENMPILADALMDAGCDNEEILGHCRSECQHVKGCWVVDLVLGKE